MNQETQAVTEAFFVLHRMLEQLPETVRILLLDQLDKTIEALKVRDAKFVQTISDKIDDALFLCNLQQFDLEATKRERDTYKKQIEGDK